MYMLHIALLLGFAYKGAGHPIHPFEQIQLSDRIIEWKIPNDRVNVSVFPRGLSPILLSNRFSHKLPLKASRPTNGEVHNRTKTKSSASDLGIEDRLRGSISCSNCKAGLFFIFSYVARSKPDENFQTFSDICIHFDVFPTEVCEGLVVRHSPTLSYIFNRANFDVNEFCATLLLNDDCMGRGKSMNENWEVALPSTPKPRPEKIQLPKEDSPSFKVLHLTDTHHDPHYVEGANAELCKEPLCCRLNDHNISKKSDGAGKWGDYRNCDPPKITVDNMFDHINDIHPDIDYIVWTGDLQPHNVWNENKEENLAVLRDMVMTIKKKFPKTPVFPAIGNHESSPASLFPQPYITDPRFSDKWLKDEIDELWRSWLHENVSSSIRYGGFYSVLVRPGFRIISMNTNFCYVINFWLMLDDVDPASHLQWLVYELQAAEKANEKVHIIGHIPPGNADCMRIWSKNYYKIVRRFESTVTGQFFGHTHGDEIQIFWDDPEDLSRAINVAYIASSVTPYANFNPGYKIYYVDGDHPETSRMVIDEEGWTFDLNDANNVKGTPFWYKLYSARSSYGMAALRPSDWSEFVNRMKNDDEIFELYYKHYWRDSPKRPKCDAACKERFICDARSGRSHDRKVLCGK